MTGHHRGHEPQGFRQCVSITRYENDLGVETRLYFDVVQLLTQLGVMPVPAKN